jgi:hypothetical protein
VKHQYFGDRRDLFLFDLVYEILTNTDLDRFTYVPMLTRDDDPDYVLKTDLENARAGAGNTVLRDYLRKCYFDGRRSLYETEGIFQLPEFDRFQYRLIRPRFQDEVRLQYFLGITPKDMERAIVLVDPDEGIYDHTSGELGEKYLRYDEIRHLYETMEDRSVLVLFQHLPKEGRYASVSRIMQGLKGWVTHGRPLIWISDRREAFFLLTKDNRRHGEVEKLVKAYYKRYDLSLDDE